MFGKIKNIFKGRNKFFVLFFFTILFVIGIGIISPVLLDNKRKNWENDLKESISNIESSATNLLNEKQKNLVRKSRTLKNEIRIFLDNKKNYSSIIEKINSEKYSEYSVEVINKNEKLIAWTSNVAIPVEDFFPLSFAPTEVFFYRSNLTTFLSSIDTIRINYELFYFAISQQVEKHFEIQNKFYEKINLSEFLAKKFQTEAEVNYSQFAKVSKDGRKISFEIRNNKNYKIGVVTFNKPSLDSRINSFNEDITDIQSIAAIAGFIFLMLGFLKDYKKIKSGVLRILLLSGVLVLFRYLLYELSIPSKFLDSPLTNSSYFASAFGSGIVKSPLELFITIIFLLIVCFSMFNFFWSYFNSNRIRKKGNILTFPVILFTSTVLFLVSLRGLGASLKSVIFDSSLRYFRETGLLPNLPAGLMQLNVLLIGLSSFLISVSIILLIFVFFPFDKNDYRKIKYAIAAIFVFFQGAGYFYDYIQSEPQGTDLIRVLFISFAFILSYKIFFEERKNPFNYAYAALAASIITVSLLNFYNAKLEQESLKTTAYELTRTNDSWLEFLVTQTLINSSLKDETYRALKDQLTNYEAAAFIIWSHSLLQREKLNSSVALLNKRKELLGSFGIELDEKYRINPGVLKYDDDGLQVFDNYRPYQLAGKIISGILPIKEDDILLGYVVVSILFDETNYGRVDYPKVLSPDFNSLNSTVDFEKLKIFDFKNGKLENVYGELTPPDEITWAIVNADFTNSEAWLKLKISSDEYIAYLLKFTRDKNERIIVVLLKEKNLSWSLYNFLKVFFIHIIFIVGFLAIIFAQQLYRAKNIKFTFRLQLLGAFLLISLLPLLLLAFYNRSLSEQKNSEATIMNLKEKALNVERYLTENAANSSIKNLNLVFNKASQELNIDYSLYSEERVKYSSRPEYYGSGLIPEYINPTIYAKFNYQGYKEYLENEEIEKYSYNSFYKKLKVNNSNYVLKVDDVFNKVSLPITGEEFDVFLFGSYSVAIILIILFSTFLANRISSPIRKLTKATASVAEGDLSLEVDSFHIGEVGDLVTGFNLMIQQLKKSQTELAEMERENAWKEMARQVAHEIKNPLTPMKLAMQQLVIAYKDRSNKFDSIFDKVSKTIIGQIETLSSIASEFSSFARMPKLRLEKFNALQSIEEAVNLFLDEKIEIVIIKSEVEFQVEADKDQLKRTIINLVRNSIQAKASKIEIELTKDENYISIKLKDNGKGIQPEVLSRVFDPNFTTKEKGMGIGLKLAKKFLEGVNGKISIVESSPAGTVILIQIPHAI
ncbi:MAG: ATP-binding protein [Ignavibacteriales bacterium]|nr:ATP-binding protein [Ignavibacteriales bacterium]